MVSKKLRKSIVSENQDNKHVRDASLALSNVDGPIEGSNALCRKFTSKKSKNDPVKMSPKVLETWINDTL